jgi:hypothetical protein
VNETQLIARDRAPLHKQPLTTLFQAPSEPFDKRPTTEQALRTAAQLIGGELQFAPSYIDHYRPQQIRSLARLLQAADVASRMAGCVRASRRNSTSRLDRRILDCCVERGLLYAFPAPGGWYEKQSRYVPSDMLVRILCELDEPPVRSDKYVELFSKETRKKESRRLRFNRKQPAAALVQEQLQLVNEVNARHTFTYRHYNPWTKQYEGWRRLHPWHVARFTDNFQRHGRMYSDGCSHQNLRRIERQSLLVDDEPTVEWDYSSMHILMLLHSEGIDYGQCPYKAVWGLSRNDAWTEPRKLLTKRAVNVMINTDKRQFALQALEAAENVRKQNASGMWVWKEGEELEDARALKDARRKVGVSFEAVYDKAYRCHDRISHRFCKDTGLRLMKLDSDIARDILCHFAEQDVPAIGIHDSFRVPAIYSAELQQVMHDVYRAKLSFAPFIHPMENSEFANQLRVAA